MTRPLICALLILTACGDRASRAPDVTLSDDQRAAVEDTVRKLIESSIAAQNRGEMQSLRERYAPTALSVQAGTLYLDVDKMFDTIDSVMKSVGNPTPKVTAKVEPIHVLSPTAAVVTTTARTSIDSAGKPVTWRNVYTGVWHRSSGKWQIVQEHASLLSAE